jgi:aminotransferase
MMQISDIISSTEQAMSIKYNTMVYDLIRSGKKVLILSLGEAFFDIPLFSMDNLPFPSIYHYSNSRGIPELRQKLAEFFIKNYDIPINYEKEILITSGSKAAIHFAFMAILNPGDEVLIHEPYWVSYPEQVKMCYGKAVNIPYFKSVYDFEEFITPNTKIIVINNPHNPTGYVYSEQELRHLLLLAEKYNLWLFSDEAYSEFVDDDMFISPGKIDKEKKHTVIFNSISKNYGISGWRLGYVIANERLIFNILKINQHLITCPATILEYYVEKYFYDILKITNPQIKALIRKRKEIADYLDKIGLEARPGNATFYFFISISPTHLTSEEFCTKLLHEYFISTVPGLGYGKSCDKFIRVSIGTATSDEIKSALNTIKKLIIETSTPETNTRSRVLVVAGGLWQRPFIKFLQNKGHMVDVADPYLHSPGVQIADRHLECDVRDYEKLSALTEKLKYEFISTDQSDIALSTVARLNSIYNLIGNSLETTEKFVNKLKMRILAESIGIPIPKFAQISGTHDLTDFINLNKLPIIIKPADSQSSRGVIKIDENNIEDIDTFVVNSLKYSNCGYLIAEEFVEGEEITVEGFASEYKHRTLAISMKKHFRTGIASELRYPAELPQNIYLEVERLNDLFVEQSGLRFGITHAEYLINAKTGRIILVEIACRGGGTLISSDIVKWVSGIDVYELFYTCLRGGIVDVKGLSVLKRPAILKFFEFPSGKVKEIKGEEDIKSIKGIISYNLSFKPGDLLKPAEDDRSRQGYFIAIAETEKELDDMVTRVNNTIKVQYEQSAII